MTCTFTPLTGMCSLIVDIRLCTGNGKQGFQNKIQEHNFVVDGMGILGNVHSERNLTYYEVALSGHM